MTRRLKLTAPERTPFFHVDGQPFVDLTYHFGDPLAIDIEALARFLATAGPGNVVIGRRLDAGERRFVRDWRHSTDSELYAWMVPREAARWRVTTGRKPRR